MRSVEVQDDFEALVVEQALPFARELKTSGAAAADGQVLAAVEQVAVVYIGKLRLTKRWFFETHSRRGLLSTKLK